MRIHLAILSFLLFALTASGQNSIKGTAFLYKEGGDNSALSEVYIKSKGGGTYLTDKKGIYRLNFDNSITQTSIAAIKPGYEVINSEELSSIDLTQNRDKNIYLDLKGNTTARIKKLQEASIKKMKTTSDAYYKTIEGGGEKARLLKAKIEANTGKRFETLEALKTYIYEKYGTDINALEGVVASLIKQNLDHANKQVEIIKALLEKGDFDSVKKMLDPSKDLKQVTNNNLQIDYRQRANKATKERYQASLPALIASADYKRLDTAYRIITAADTLDFYSYYDYGKFLIDQDQFNPAMSCFERCLTIETDTNSLRRYFVFARVAFMTAETKQNDETWELLTECRRILLYLHQANPDIDYIPHFLENFRALAKTATSLKNYAQGIAFQLNSIEFLKTFSERDTTYQSEMVASLQLLANLYQEDGQSEKALEVYNQAIALLTRLTKSNPEDYLSDLASVYNNRGMHYLGGKDYASAKQDFESSLKYSQVDLVEKSDDTDFLKGVAILYNNLGLVNSTLGELTTAKNYLLKGIALNRKLVAKNKNRYQEYLSLALGNLARTSIKLKDYPLAQQSLDEASRIDTVLAHSNLEAHGSQLVYNLQLYAELYLTKKDTTRALNKLYDALNVVYFVSKTDSTTSDPQLANLLSCVAQIELKTDSTRNRALIRLEAAYDIFEHHPRSQAYAYEIDKIQILWLKGQLYEADRKYDKAEEIYLALIERFQPIVDSVLANQAIPLEMDYLQSTFRKLFALYYQNQRNEAQLASVRRATPYFRRAYQLDPINYEVDFKDHLDKVGIIEQLYGEKEKAIMNYQELLRVYKDEKVHDTDRESNRLDINGKLLGLFEETKNFPKAIDQLDVLLLDAKQTLNKSVNAKNAMACVEFYETYFRIYNQSGKKDSLGGISKRILALTELIISNKNTTEEDRAKFYSHATENAFFANEPGKALTYGKKLFENNTSDFHYRGQYAVALLLNGHFDFSKAILNSFLAKDDQEQRHFKDYSIGLLQGLKALDCIPKMYQKDVEQILVFLAG